MKKPVTLLTLALFGAACSTQVQAQSLFTTSEELNIGNIVTPHLVHGDMWWNPATGTSPMQFPKGVKDQLHGVAAIWMGGYDTQNQLKAAAQDYRSKGSDFWPGPITAGSSSATNAITRDWAKIWKINSATIDAYLAMSTHTTANTPAEILEWPGKGNTYAKGAAGVGLTVSTDMAPFVDVNSNGIYEPLTGDYPKMKGSQMLWWVLNDRSLHPNSQTMPLDAEVRVSAYAYNKGTLADNIIFYEYDLLNTSSATYSNFVFASMADLDIAYAFDDYAGFDSSRRLAAIYDGGPGTSPSRGIAAGYALLDQPGDAWQQYSAAGAMTTYMNGSPNNFTDPQNGLENYRLMTGYNRGGDRLNGNSNYAINSLISQCQAGLPMNDRRFVLSTTPTTFGSQQRLHYAFAFVAADSAGICPNVDFSTLEQTTDTAYKLYWNPARVTPGTTNVPNSLASQFAVYPNPAQTTLNITGTISPDAAVSVINAVGATLSVPVQRTSGRLELLIETLPVGVYVLRIAQNGQLHHARFVKK